MDPLFEVHILNPNGIEKAQAIANLFDAFITELEDLVPWTEENARYVALFRTKLEEASFFAKKAMAVDSNNQRDDATP